MVPFLSNLSVQCRLYIFLLLARFDAHVFRIKITGWDAVINVSWSTYFLTFFNLLYLSAGVIYQLWGALSLAVTHDFN